MIRKITVEQLQPGMFVHKLDCSWLDHPFARNSFLIKDEDDLKKLTGIKIKEITIDTSKGADIPEAPPVLKHDTSPPKGSSNAQKNSQKTAPSHVPVDEERGQAEIVKKQAGKVISDIMGDVRLGKQVDAERVSPVVEQMMGSVFRNQDALFGLTRIRQMDQYTFEHSVSVSVLLIAFAKTLGLNESIIRELGVGGLLHDIGKMRVPDQILNKPGRLTEEEFTVMRGHVNYGRAMLENVDNISEPALQVMAQHHERIDGSGYPDKLPGDAISLYGKMAAIVDVYDAITSDRVYHKGQLPSVVLGRQVEWSGSHFDPQLVQRFIQCVGIYPVGSLVALESERLAIVTASSEEGLLKPTVKIIYDLRKRRFLTPRLLDLANQPEGSEDRILHSELAEHHGIRTEVFME